MCDGRISGEVEPLIRDFCELSPDEIEQYLGQSDLLIFGTDSFPAQARGNREALGLNKAAIWLGLYQGARAGEIVYWVPGVTPACYRCICSARYRAYTSVPAPQHRSPLPISSNGGTIFDLHLLDSIAGQIAVGILTRGSDDRFGRLIDQLGNRNFLQIKIDPAYTLGGKDIFRQYLGDHPANFSFTTIALQQEPEATCHDCQRFRQERAA